MMDPPSMPPPSTTANAVSAVRVACVRSPARVTRSIVRADRPEVGSQRWKRGNPQVADPGPRGRQAGSTSSTAGPIGRGAPTGTLATPRIVGGRTVAGNEGADEAEPRAVVGRARRTAAKSQDSRRAAQLRCRWNGISKTLANAHAQAIESGTAMPTVTANA